MPTAEAPHVLSTKMPETYLGGGHRGTGDICGGLVDGMLAVEQACGKRQRVLPAEKGRGCCLSKACGWHACCRAGLRKKAEGAVCQGLVDSMLAVEQAAQGRRLKVAQEDIAA
eukprot:1161766-Pelagomonas_calceolata.AAC.4